MKIRGFLVDLEKRETFPAEISLKEDKICNIRKVKDVPARYIIPGLIDAHIHIESTMVAPSAFGNKAVEHGTVAVVSDPHEIANVVGTEGVKFMLNNSRNSSLKFYFGAPSCVPATDFETAGARIGSQEIAELLENKDIRYLSEMMNFPGVINGEKEVYRKLNAARERRKPIDGHAPGLTGEPLKKYVNAGITTDHECTSVEEALEKISLGMKILIREGSAARNLDTLKKLFYYHPDKLMLCSDDLHPDMLMIGHINKLIAKLIRDGYDRYDVLRSASVIPSSHYGIGTGLIRKGERADIVVVDDLSQMNVLETWIEGIKVYESGQPLKQPESPDIVNNFNCGTIDLSDIELVKKTGTLRIIEAADGSLFTKQIVKEIYSLNEYTQLEESDVLKIVVKERYRDSRPVAGYVKGFGLRKGAFASSVSHDSHNIIAVGTNDADIVSAVNEIVRMKGGLAVSFDQKMRSLQLSIGGIMSDKSVDEVAREYSDLDELVKQLGCSFKTPFMTLSFMALLVIPELKISDKGLFDVNAFRPVSLYID